ncbi:MAG: IS630 family transposase [Hyphomicrobiales bacterium]
MTKPYPREMRLRAARFVKAGQSRNAVAKRLGVSVSCVVKWLLRHEATGSVKPGLVGGHRPRKIIGEHRDWVAAGGDVTLQDLADGLAARGIKVDYRTMWNFVRDRWRKYQSRIDIRRLVFIDEAWTKTNMAPPRGWGAKVKRLVARVPHGHWTTQTFLAALRSDAITAPCLFDGPINGESFLRYVEQFLLPTLKSGDVVVMDNLGSHKADAIRQVIRSAGARLIYLPPYSPDLNPVEQAISKLKHALRKAKERSVEQVCDRIGEILKTSSSTDCRSYFVNAGYCSV